MIKAEGVVKKLGKTTVLDGLSLDVATGETFALLGPNGAGKTTLLKCLVGLWQPIGGTITIDGLDRRRDHMAIKTFTAWLPDEPFAYLDYDARLWLETVADAYGVKPEARDRRIDQLLDAFALAELGTKPIGQFSQGQRKKLGLAALLVSDSKLLIMDEPFTGEIDPPGIATFRAILKGLHERGDVTIVFSTQIVSEAEQLATRVGLLHGGRIAAHGTPAELCAHYGVDKLEDVLLKIAGRSPAEGAARFLGTLP